MSTPLIYHCTPIIVGLRMESKHFFYLYKNLFHTFFITCNAPQPLTVQSEVQVGYASGERPTSLHTSRCFSHFQTCSLKLQLMQTQVTSLEATYQISHIRFRSLWGVTTRVVLKKKGKQRCMISMREYCTYHFILYI